MKTETLAQFLARGGRIKKLPTARQFLVQREFKKTLTRLFDLRQNRTWSI